MIPSLEIFELTTADDPSNLNTTAPIVVCDSLGSEYVLSLFSRSKIQHIIQKSNLNHQSEIQISATMLQSPDQFRQFPLSTILGVHNPTSDSEAQLAEVNHQLSHPDEKSLVLDQIEKWVAESNHQRSIANDVRLIADELISNSIFNAPYVDFENSFSGPTRDKNKISIDPAKKPRVFIGRDHDRLIVGCQDFYGTLNVNRVIERIRICYESNPGQVMNFGTGGAGIGSFMVFDSCSSLYIAVEVGVSTTICCALPLKMSAVRRKKIPKNLHISSEESKWKQK